MFERMQELRTNIRELRQRVCDFRNFELHKVIVKTPLNHIEFEFKRKS